MRHPLAVAAGVLLAAAAVSSLATLSACAPQSPQAQVVTPTETASTVATHTEPAETTAAPGSAEEATTPPSTTTKPPTTTKPKPKPSSGTLTKAEAALAIKTAVNATLDKGSDPRAKFTSVDIKVLEKDANGTYWAGADLTNDLDGGIVFAKKKAGGSWTIIDYGTGIDGTEMKGKTSAAIAAKFATAFMP
jgi:hypothetical protein